MTLNGSTTCPNCDGTGNYGPDRDDDPCEMCQATGTCPRSHTPECAYRRDGIRR